MTDDVAQILYPWHSNKAVTGKQSVTNSSQQAIEKPVVVQALAETASTLRLSQIEGQASNLPVSWTSKQNMQVTTTGIPKCLHRLQSNVFESFAQISLKKLLNKTGCGPII